MCDVVKIVICHFVIKDFEFSYHSAFHSKCRGAPVVG